MSIPYVQTPSAVSVFHDGRAIVIPNSHVNYQAILEAIQYDDDDSLELLLDVKATISKWSLGQIEIVDRVLTYAGVPLNNTLTQKIVDFMHDDQPGLAQPLINFLDKVMQNPSYRAVQGLYDWVAASGMPIHEDGDLLAWKIVRHDWHDYHTGTLDHSPGKTVSQPRNMCDEDPDQTCSAGIHFCSYNYLDKYHQEDESRRVVLVKVNPRDVTAIPRDYNTAKGRCCRLVSIQEVPEPEGFFTKSTVWSPPTFKLGQVWQDAGGDHLIIVGRNFETGEVQAQLDYDDPRTFDVDGGGLVRRISEPDVDWDEPLADGWVFVDVVRLRGGGRCAKLTDGEGGYELFDLQSGDPAFDDRLYPVRNA